MIMINRELKSRVMALGNRLAKTMPRCKAFVQAWKISKSGAVCFAVKGVSFGNRQEALKRLAAYNPAQVRAFLLPETSNPVDGNALAVMVGVNGGRGYYKLGYVPVADTAKAAATRGRVSIRVLQGDIYGVRVALAV
jgi:hypothetical protein